MPDFEDPQKNNSPEEDAERLVKGMMGEDAFEKDGVDSAEEATRSEHKKRIEKEIEEINKAVGSEEVYNKYHQEEDFDVTDPQGWAEKKVAEKEAEIRGIENEDKNKTGGGEQVRRPKRIDDKK